MAAAFTWSLKQSTPVIYLVWGTMGLGMALPYLLIGVFPGLVQALPRPGMWMVRFKQLSAFAMFGAAIFFLQAVDQRNILPVLVAALGLGLGLWMIGSLYDRETPLVKKMMARASAIVLGGSTCALAFWMHWHATAEFATHLEWKKFESETFVSARKAGTPMLVDFTADWCLICKTNERTSLDTAATAEFVREHGIVTYMADWTNENDEIREWLNLFGQDSVPLTIIVPPDPKAKIITLSGRFSQGELLSKMQEAMQAVPGVAHAGEGARVSVASSRSGSAE
jgi:thiol:disulfide interchange protein